MKCMMINIPLRILIIFNIFLLLNCEENQEEKITPCVNIFGQPNSCHPPYDNFASTGRKVISTNTCGLRGRQKYCIGLSSAEMTSRCAYCDNSKISERHSADYLTDLNPNNWWQSETWAENRELFNRESINLTIDLGKQFVVAFVHLQFKSPRPSAMVIYRKFDNNSPWEPWQYFASNCFKYFNMSFVKERIIKKHDEVLCTEEFSSLNQFYNGIVMFATIHGRPGSEHFMSTPSMINWATASKIRIELRNMHTFGEQNDEEELLMTYFYAIKSLQISGRCWCNGHGNECRKSTGEGLEPQLYCVCHPTHHTTGQSCEKCDNFYEDIPWKPATPSNANVCQRCKCNDNSDSCIFNEDLYIQSGNNSGGLCLNCRGNTKGAHCEECLEGFYRNPDQLNRCIPCNCDPIGRASSQCNSQGICTCQPGVEGEKCTRCKGDHYNFGSMGCQPCNCHLPGVNTTERLHCNPSTGTCYCKKNVQGEKCDTCVAGFFSLIESDPLGCRPCFCFAHTKDCTMAKGFLLTQIESEFYGYVDGWKYGFGDISPEYNPMLDIITSPPSITWYMSRDPWRDDYFFIAPKKFLGNRRLSYNLNLILTLSFGFRPENKPLNNKFISMINDVRLISDLLSVSVPFDIGENPIPIVNNKSIVYKFRLNEESGLWRDKLDYFRFHSILSNLEAIKIRLTNPSGYIRLHKVVLETALDNELVKSFNLNLPEAKSVEKCLCPPQYTGLSCENCAAGYHREYPKGSEFVKCIKCMCNNQSDTCHVQTGACDCMYNTIGHTCEKCQTGYYGDPTSQIRNICKPCGCPGGTACELVKIAGNDRVVCTDCPNNLGGYRCDRCRDNFFGNPKLNITCKPCDCHGNIDYFSSCDSITGKCQNCIYNSAGDYCETCKPGYHLFSNERAPNRCKRCICNPFGSIDGGVSCDVNTGQCYCSSLVTGQKCDDCRPGYFNLTADKACQFCACLPIGSVDITCHKTTGQCKCKPGVTGLHCDRCEIGYFNLSNTGCQKCFCDPDGSSNIQCHLKTGVCSCKPNVIGSKCDQCMENYYNMSTTGCQLCPLCYGLIQKRLNNLKYEISRLSDSMKSVNISDSNLGNFTKVLIIAKEYNNTFDKLLQKIGLNFANIEKFKEELESLTKFILDLEKDLTKFATNETNEKLWESLNEVKRLEIKLQNLLDQTLKENLRLLEEHVRSKNENNKIITQNAENAKLHQTKATTKIDSINKILMKSEKQMNESLNSFDDLIKRYMDYKNASLQFDVKSLTLLSKNVISDSLKNFGELSQVNIGLGKFKTRLNETKQKYEKLVNEINDVKNYFVGASSQIYTLDEKFRNLVLNIPDVKSLEELVKNKINNISLKTRNFTEAQNLIFQLNEAQNNLTDAMNKANRTLIKLQDLYKDFNEVVNKSKIEAEEQIKRLPYLNVTLQTIIAEIKELNESSIDSITKMLSVRNDLENIYKQSIDLSENIKLFSNQVLQLMKTSEENMKNIRNIENLSDKQLKDYLSFEEKINELTNSLKISETVNEEQASSISKLDMVLTNLMNQLNNIKNESEITKINTLKIYTNRIDRLEKEFMNYYQNELEIVNKNKNDLDKELGELNNELQFANKEIRRLQLIDEHMVEVDEQSCYKSGGTTEGRL